MTPPEEGSDGDDDCDDGQRAGYRPDDDGGDVWLRRTLILGQNSRRQHDTQKRHGTRKPSHYPASSRTIQRRRLQRTP